MRELTSGQRLPYDDFFSYFLVRIQESDTYHFLENRAINWNLNRNNESGGPDGLPIISGLSGTKCLRALHGKNPLFSERVFDQFISTGWA